jgi:hypothetical protein
MAMLVMLSAGSALVLMTVTETKISAYHRSSAEVLYASDAGLERALVDLAGLGDWNAALAGAAASTFTDGPRSSIRFAAGTRVDLGEETNRLNCGRRTACSDADIAAVSAERPWGNDNPRWQLYAWGPLDRLSAAGRSDDVYLAVWVGDDPGETDGDPLRDGADVDNPGRGILALTAIAFGPNGVRRVTEATVARKSDPDAAGVDGSALRTVSWREVR